MSTDVYYDDSNLQRLFEQLTPAQRKRMFRGAMGRAATTVRKSAVKNLRSSIHSSKDLEKGIRKIVYKQKLLGFRLTVGTKRASKDGKRKAVGFHRNRQGKDKPVLIWAEEGTVRRKAKSGARFKSGNKWVNTKSKDRGKMRASKFMEAAKRQSMPRVATNVREEITKGIIKMAKKYGCS